MTGYVYQHFLALDNVGINEMDQPAHEQLYVDEVISALLANRPGEANTLATYERRRRQLFSVWMGGVFSQHGSAVVYRNSMTTGLPWDATLHLFVHR